MLTLPPNKDWPTVKNEIYAKNVLWATALARSRFKWTGFGAGLRTDVLERYLLFQGKASIAPYGDGYVVGKVGGIIKHDVYREPIAWETVMEDGTHIESTALDSVIVHDTVSRTPTFPVLQTICKMTTSAEITGEWNSDDQRNPFIYKCPKKKVQTLKALFKQVRNGEKAIIGDDLLDDSSVSVINPQVNFIADRLEGMLAGRRSELYRFLGIDHLPFEKKERLITAEADTIFAPILIRRNDFLEARRIACERFNEITGANVSVEFVLDSKSGGDEDAQRPDAADDCER